MFFLFNLLAMPSIIFLFSYFLIFCICIWVAMQKLGPMTPLFHSIKSQSAELKLLHSSCYDGSIGLTRGTLDVSDTVSSVTLLSLTLSTGGCLPKMILVLCEGPQHQRRSLSTDGKWLINLFPWTRVWPFEWKSPACACRLVFACLRMVVCS